MHIADGYTVALSTGINKLSRHREVVHEAPHGLQGSIERLSEVVPMDRYDKLRTSSFDNFSPVGVRKGPRLPSQSTIGKENDVCVDTTVHARDEVSARMDKNMEAIMFNEIAEGAPRP